jgi:hypothetical protein
MRDYFHELYGDDPFDDERRVVPDGGPVRAPVTFHLARCATASDVFPRSS